MTDQRFCVHNPPVQCVEVKFVTIVDGFDTQRHFDQILIQTIPQVEAIRRWFISNNPRFPGSAETNSTIAHIELYDHNNHGLLADMLNGYSFHGNKLKSGPGRQTFHGMDTCYRFRGISCVLCSRFGESLYTNTGARASTVKSIASNYKADDEESDCDSFDKWSSSK